MKCNRCSLQAKISLAYGPHRFCGEHFIEFTEKRAKKTIGKNRFIKRGEKIAIGLSGGKDSTATAYILNKFYSKTNSLVAVMLDEGIKGYRDKALKAAVKNCEEWGLEYRVEKFKNRFGLKMTDVMKKVSGDKELGSSCSFCGPMRRFLLNRVSAEIKADKIATGHNLDDEAQSILMNFFENDWTRMARLGAISGGKEVKGFVPRIKPLYEIPEQEVTAYVNFLELNHYSGECCPFSHMAKRNHFRSILNQMESSLPGTKFKVMRSFNELKPFLEKKAGKGAVRYCKECGSPSGKAECRACEQLKKLSAQNS